MSELTLNKTNFPPRHCSLMLAVQQKKFSLYFLIKSYKQLNTGKFAVIHEIEKHLPLALYKYEWQVLGEGKDKTKYYPFSHVELWIPRIFGILYLALGICFVVLLFK